MLEYDLTGPRGDSPLGLLTCLGALATLEDAGQSARLGWAGVRPRLQVSPEVQTPEALIGILHRTLRRERGSGAGRLEAARKEMEKARTALKKKREELKKRRPDRETRRRELESAQRKEAVATGAFKEELARGAADPAVALGKNLTALNADFIEYLAAACEGTSGTGRRWADLAAAYGVADPALPGERMLANPWALVSGSGHQDFLSSVEELMLQCTSEHVSQALFGPWEPGDEKYSLRLDAADDRRYALMDQDPTAGGNKPLTMWGANRLAFEGLRFFPAMPAAGGMEVLAWRACDGNWRQGCRVRWPLWSRPAGSGPVRSLLALRDLWLDERAARDRLRGMGVHAVMESRRIAVGEGANVKYNLTPAAPVWVSA